MIPMNDDNNINEHEDNTDDHESGGTENGETDGVAPTDGATPDEFASESEAALGDVQDCLLYTSPSPRDRTRTRMPSSA